MDWQPVLEKGIVPGLTAVGGFIGAAYQWALRIKRVEEELSRHKAEIEGIKRGFRLELDDVKGEISDRFRELIKRMEESDDSFSRFRDSAHDFATEENLASFIEEQHGQWQQIQRTLGQIEGMMRTMK